MKAILLIIWIIFSMLEGKRDASFYHANMSCPNPVKENLHWLFTMTRGIVFVLIGWVCFIKYSIFANFMFLGGLALIFSFLHNGMYFLTRNKLDSNVYPKGFWDDSTSSTAFFDFNIKERIIFAVIGCIGIITSIISDNLY